MDEGIPWGPSMLRIPRPRRDASLVNAVKLGDLHGVKSLLEAKSDVNETSEEGNTPLSCAAARGSVDAVDLLLKHGADFEMPNVFGQTPLYRAVEKMHIEALRSLLRAKADPNVADRKKRSPLGLAAQHCYVDTVKLLLSHSADPDVLHHDITPLHRAARDGHSDMAKLLVAHRASVDLIGPEGCTPLGQAARRNRCGVAKVLLEHNADPSIPDEIGWTPLANAACGGKTKFVSILLKHNDVDSGTIHRQVQMLIDTAQTAARLRMLPLHVAALLGKTEVARLLIKCKEDVNSPIDYARVEAYLCRKNAESGKRGEGIWDFNGVSVSVDGVNSGGGDDGLDSCDPVDALHRLAPHLDGATPLHAAVQNGSHDIVKRLLRRGARVGDTRKDGQSALHLAVAFGHESIVRMLLQRKDVELSVFCNAGRNPFHVACSSGNLHLVKLLKKHGPEGCVDSLTKDGDSSLMLASASGSLPLVELLLASQCDVNVRNPHGHSAIMRACEHGHEEIVSLLLKHGASVADHDVLGVSCLQLAAKSGDARVVSLLMKKSADVNSVSSNCDSPLVLATVNSHVKVVSLLLEHGADVHHRTKERNTPLHIAALSGKKKSGRALLAFRAPLDAINAAGDTPLHLAVEAATTASSSSESSSMASPRGDCDYSHVAFAELLLSKNAAVDIANHMGYTPLFLAAEAGHTSLVDLLLQNDADVNINFNKKRRSPLAIASLNGHMECVESMLHHRWGSEDHLYSYIEWNHSGRVLDIQDSNPHPGASVHLWKHHGKRNQLWVYDSKKRFRSKFNDFALDVSPIAENEYSVCRLVVNEPSSAPSQQWILDLENHSVRNCLTNGFLATDDSSESAFVVCEPAVDLSSPRYRFTLATPEFPLDLAVRSQHARIASLLLQDRLLNNKLRVGKKSLARTLVLAVTHGHPKLIEHVVKMGFDVSRWPLEASGDLRTPLLVHAVRQPRARLAIVKQLLAHGADIDALDESGSSAMLVATACGHSRVAEYLIHRGGNVTFENQDGVSVLDVAAALNQQRGNARVLNALRRRYSVKTPGFVESDDLSNIKTLADGNFGITYCAELRVRRRGHIVQVGAYNDKQKFSGPCELTHDCTVPVVCKCPKFGNSQHEWFELEVLQNVSNHPHVLGLLGICMAFVFDGKKSVSIMVPFQHGGSLLDYVERFSPLPFSQIEHFARDMAAGIAHLHASGYRHNDIACRNFLLREPVDDQGKSRGGPQQILLSDFGLSRPHNYKPDKIDLVPWRWSAPETLANRGRLANTATDVWMLGIAFWELLGLKKFPFYWLSSPAEIIDSIRASGQVVLPFPDPPRECTTESLIDGRDVELDAYHRLTDAILKCCSLNPKSRPTARVIATELLNPFEDYEDDSTDGSADDDDRKESNPAFARAASAPAKAATSAPSNYRSFPPLSVHPPANASNPSHSSIAAPSDGKRSRSHPPHLMASRHSAPPSPYVPLPSNNVLKSVRSQSSRAAAKHHRNAPLRHQSPSTLSAKTRNRSRHRRSASSQKASASPASSRGPRQKGHSRSPSFSTPSSHYDLKGKGSASSRNGAPRGVRAPMPRAQSMRTNRKKKKGGSGGGNPPAYKVSHSTPSTLSRTGRRKTSAAESKIVSPMSASPRNMQGAVLSPSAHPSPRNATGVRPPPSVNTSPRNTKGAAHLPSYLAVEHEPHDVSMKTPGSSKDDSRRASNDDSRRRASKDDSRRSHDSRHSHKNSSPSTNLPVAQHPKFPPRRSSEPESSRSSAPRRSSDSLSSSGGLSSRPRRSEPHGAGLSSRLSSPSSGLSSRPSPPSAGRSPPYKSEPPDEREEKHPGHNKSTLFSSGSATASATNESTRHPHEALDTYTSLACADIAAPGAESARVSRDSSRENATRSSPRNAPKLSHTTSSDSLPVHDEPSVSHTTNSSSALTGDEARSNAGSHSFQSPSHVISPTRPHTTHDRRLSALGRSHGGGLMSKFIARKTRGQVQSATQTRVTSSTVDEYTAFPDTDISMPRSKPDGSLSSRSQHGPSRPHLRLDNQQQLSASQVGTDNRVPPTEFARRSETSPASDVYRVFDLEEAQMPRSNARIHEDMRSNSKPPAEAHHTASGSGAPRASGEANLAEDAMSGRASTSTSNAHNGVIVNPAEEIYGSMMESSSDDEEDEEEEAGRGDTDPNSERPDGRPFSSSSSSSPSASNSRNAGALARISSEADNGRESAATTSRQDAAEEIYGYMMDSSSEDEEEEEDEEVGGGGTDRNSQRPNGNRLSPPSSSSHSALNSLNAGPLSRSSGGAAVDNAGALSLSSSESVADNSRGSATTSSRQNAADEIYGCFLSDSSSGSSDDDDDDRDPAVDPSRRLREVVPSQPREESDESSSQLQEVAPSQPRGKSHDASSQLQEAVPSQPRNGTRAEVETARSDLDRGSPPSRRDLSVTNAGAEDDTPCDSLTRHSTNVDVQPRANPLRQSVADGGAARYRSFYVSAVDLPDVGICEADRDRGRSGRKTGSGSSRDAKSGGSKSSRDANASHSAGFTALTSEDDFRPALRSSSTPRRTLWRNASASSPHVSRASSRSSLKPRSPSNVGLPTTSSRSLSLSRSMSGSLSRAALEERPSYNARTPTLSNPTSSSSFGSLMSIHSSPVAEADRFHSADPPAPCLLPGEAGYAREGEAGYAHEGEARMRGQTGGESSSPALNANSDRVILSRGKATTEAEELRVKLRAKNDEVSALRARLERVELLLRKEQTRNEDLTVRLHRLSSSSS